MEMEIEYRGRIIDKCGSEYISYAYQKGSGGKHYFASKSLKGVKRDIDNVFNGIYELLCFEKIEDSPLVVKAEPETEIVAEPEVVKVEEVEQAQQELSSQEVKKVCACCRKDLPKKRRKYCSDECSRLSKISYSSSMHRWRVNTIRGHRAARANGRISKRNGKPLFC